jgi:hypothetical protein
MSGNDADEVRGEGSGTLPCQLRINVRPLPGLQKRGTGGTRLRSN